VSRSWTTERLLIRQIRPEDAPIVRDYGLRSREFHRPWDPVRPSDFWELPVVADRLATELELAGQDRSLAVYLSPLGESDRVIGRIALNNIVRGACLCCAAGYGLSPDATGQGYMTEALQEMVRVAFHDLGLHRVEVNVIPRNTRSIALAERCGFEREGLSPRYLRIAGRWEDHLRFARRNLAMEAE